MVLVVYGLESKSSDRLGLSQDQDRKVWNRLDWIVSTGGGVRWLWVPVGSVTGLMMLVLGS
jgi:hypothetical protein